MRTRLILDDGTPNCLPHWARDEIVRRRLESEDLRVENSCLRVELAEARGADLGEALLDEWKRQMAEVEQLFADREPR